MKRIKLTPLTTAPLSIRLIRAILALTAFCACGALAACNLGPRNDGPVSVITPTPPRPTATTNVPPPGAPAVLGAPGQTFITKYGAPTNQSPPGLGELHLIQYGSLPTDYLVIQEGKFLNLSYGANAVATITVTAAPGMPWPNIKAEQICQAFAPTDAQMTQHVLRATSQGGTPTGWDDVYQSNALANTFPSSAFVDVNQNQAPTGTFDISYVYASSGDTKHITTCTLALGSRQTLG